MNEILRFMGEHPILTFLLACICMWTFVGTVQAVALAFRRRDP